MSQPEGVSIQQAWDPRPRGPRTANLVSSCCPCPRDTLFHWVLVLEDRWNSCVLMRTAYEDIINLVILGFFFKLSEIAMFSWDHSHHILMRTSHEDFGGLESILSFTSSEWKNILAHINIKQEDWLSSWGQANLSSSSSWGLLQYTVLILVLSITALKGLVLEDRWTVLVPSLPSKCCPARSWTISVPECGCNDNPFTKCSDRPGHHHLFHALIFHWQTYLKTSHFWMQGMQVRDHLKSSTSLAKGN